MPVFMQRFNAVLSHNSLRAIAYLHRVLYLSVFLLIFELAVIT